MRFLSNSRMSFGSARLMSKQKHLSVFILSCSSLKGKESRRLAWKKISFHFFDLHLCLYSRIYLFVWSWNPFYHDDKFVLHTMIWSLSQWKPKMFNVQFVFAHSSVSILLSFVIIHFRFHRCSFHFQSRPNTIYSTILWWT